MLKISIKREKVERVERVERVELERVERVERVETEREREREREKEEKEEETAPFYFQSTCCMGNSTKKRPRPTSKIQAAFGDGRGTNTHGLPKQKVMRIAEKNFNFDSTKCAICCQNLRRTADPPLTARFNFAQVAKTLAILLLLFFWFGFLGFPGQGPEQPEIQSKVSYDD